MNRRSSAWLVCLPAVCMCVCAVSAQQDERAQTLLNSWDKNKNGLLERSEIPVSSRRKIAALAKKEKMDLDKGLPINQLLGGESKKSLEFAKETKDEGKEIPVEEGDGAKIKDVEPNADLSGKPPPTNRGKGFGDQGASIPMKSFGSEEPQDASAKEDEDSPEKDETRDKAKKSPERKRLRVLAKAMLVQHDSNKDGQLQRDEWSRLRGNPGASDRDRDGVLTVEELEEHLGGFAESEKPPRAPEKSKRPRRSGTPSTGKTYRFLTPHERLPKGLPDWFADKDQNRDGQIALHEYASSLSQAELNAFRALDLNNDGFVVAREYLKSTD